MPAGNDFNNQQLKQHGQYLTMRGAQIAEQNAGQKTELGSQPRAQGARKQLIGTIVGIGAFFALLILLMVFHVIG